MLWAYFVSLPSYSNIFYTHTSPGAGIVSLQLDGNKLNIWTTDGTSGSTTIVVNTWYHITFTKDGNDSARVYLNGVSEATRAIGSTSASIVNDIGSWSGNSDAPDARYAACKIWTAALTADEIAAEMRVVRPVRITNLFGWYPMFGATGEQGRDYSGNGSDFTTVGTLTAEDGPPVSWGGAVQYVSYITSGPAAQNASVGLVESGIEGLAVSTAPGGISVAVGQASAQIVAYAPSAQPGGIAVAVGQSLATIEGYAPQTVQAQSIGVGAAVATVAGYAPTTVPGGISAAPGIATAQGEGYAPAAVPGGITATVEIATAGIEAYPVSATLNDTSQAIGVGLAAANVEAYALVGAPGLLSVGVGSAAAQVEGYEIDTARAMVIGVGMAEAQTEGAEVGVSFGVSLAAVGIAEATIEGYAPAAYPGAITAFVGLAIAHAEAYAVAPGELAVTGNVVTSDGAADVAAVSHWLRDDVLISDSAAGNVSVGNHQ